MYRGEGASLGESYQASASASSGGRPVDETKEAETG